MLGSHVCSIHGLESLKFTGLPDVSDKPFTPTDVGLLVGKKHGNSMLIKRIFVTSLMLFEVGISHAIDKYDVQVCEAVAQDANKIKCYIELNLSNSCNNLDPAKQLSCYRNSAESLITQESNKLSQQVELNKNSNNDFFGQPHRLCSALTTQGINTGGWKASKSFPGEWVCMSSLISFGAAGSNGMENNIALYVNGTSQTRANDIRIKININNPAEREMAFTRLEDATKSLFNAISEPVPQDLAKALSGHQTTSVPTRFGKAEIILETGRIDSFKVVLTDAKTLAEKAKTQTKSAEEFSACKSVTANAAGYSVALISGDGQPIQEAGYKSFMLNGRGKDLFFCEVHSGGRYKVRAALNGTFPFKAIAEGKF